ncbi:MAG: DUF1257 domain-containing protein [Acidobacteriaceae bacterium]|nr:DUF1257 domain-containing protein [Acidobacteriaceae bacterium]
MSKYDSFQTALTEEAPLVGALQALGYPVEIHKNGAPLFGYHGDQRPERAHVIIRRQHLDAASNDIGFVRAPDGQFRAILSEYDQSIGFDQKWLGCVHQRYKEERTMAMARNKGYIFRGREVIQTERGQQVKLLFVAR